MRVNKAYIAPKGTDQEELMKANFGYEWGPISIPGSALYEAGIRFKEDVGGIFMLFGELECTAE